MVLADFESYLQAQKKIEENWHDQRSWAQKALVNIAHSEEFNADNTVARYAKDIWGLKKLN